MDTYNPLKAEFDLMYDSFNGSPYLSKEKRIELLSHLKDMLLGEKEALVSALNHDYGFRSESDSVICDLMPSVQHINYTIKQLPKWIKPQKRHAGLLLTPSKLQVIYQPLGVVGVIVPWNFPIYLSIAPIVTAIAAGNRVMVKLSEYTPETNQILTRIFSGFSDTVRIIEGDVGVATAFSTLPFQHLFFTGSTQVGKLVARAAANNLTPITLELGGKSPVVIAPDAKITSAIDAIMLGKSMNAGQICVAPDYVFVPEDKMDEFIRVYSKRFLKAFPENAGKRQYSHIINAAQHKRLKEILDDAEKKGALITSIIDSQHEPEGCLFPRIVTGVTQEMRLMKEEIFGPILPLMPYKSIDETITYIKERPRPLALYVMSKDKSLIERFKLQTHSGGLVVNDTTMHVAADDAPFGGIGDSGMGSYHGIEGFKTFSHAKTTLYTPMWLPRAKWLLKYKKSMLKAINFQFMK